MKTKRLIYFISRGKPHGLCILLKGIVPANCLLLVLMTLYSFVPAPLSESIELEKIPNLIIENNLRSGIDGDPLYTELKIQNPITGTVEDLGGPIPGVFVQIKDTNRTTMTDENGYYSISASPGEVLVFSYPGYETVEWIVGLDTVIDIEMYESFTYLDEAVINAGYYTVKDRERTGSIYRVTADEIEKQPVNNVLEALQGRVPGLDIVSTTGVAGGGYTVRIRGQNSIAAGNEPLYIIDGVPFENTSLSSQSVSGTIFQAANISPLNTIDPSTIESIEVLKDADATAIYGSRGANGVILITTKLGNKGKTKILAEFSSAYSKVTKMAKMLNTQQYIQMREQAFTNDGISELPFNAYDINGTWSKDRYTDWQKLFIGNTAVNNLARINISGGNDQTQFTVGNSFSKETTVFPFDYNYKKNISNLRLNHSLPNQKFKLSFSASYGIDNNFLPTTDLTSSSRILPPNAPEIYDVYGNLNWENNTWVNPYADLQSTYRNNTQNLISNVLLDYKIIKAHKFKLNLGYSVYSLKEKVLNPHTRFNPSWGYTSEFSSLMINESTRSSWIVEPQFDGHINFGESKLSYTIGATLNELNSEHLAQIGIGFPTNLLLNNISAAETSRYLRNDKLQYKYAAVFSRINYNYRGKYIINLTGRRDGSSRFGPGNKYSNFGAIGAAWIFTRENMFTGVTWLSFGKIRGSIGITGNDQIGDYQYTNSYSIADYAYNSNIGLTPIRLFNSDYSWEKNKKIEAGLELGLFQNKLGLELAYYKGESNNQLVGIPLPATTGFNSINANLDALVENSGFELSLQSTNIKTENFEWNLTLQSSFPSTKLKKFDNLESSSYANLLAIGYPLNIYKMYKFLGVNSETGLFEFQDFNGDGVISFDDRQYIADLNPQFHGNISNSFIYKNFALNFSFQFVKRKNYNEFFTSSPAGYMFNQPVSVLNNWLNSGETSAYQVLTTGGNHEAVVAHSNYALSSAAISDASFIRLKTLSLSYDLPLSEKLNATIYLQGYNLLTFTKFKGGDPEQQFGFLPPLKTVSIGTKIEF